MIIWANLDCEARWGGAALPLRVAKRISAASALLAAFASDGEPVTGHGRTKAARRQQRFSSNIVGSLILLILYRIFFGNSRSRR